MPNWKGKEVPECTCPARSERKCCTCGREKGRFTAKVENELHSFCRDCMGSVIEDED